MSPDRNFRAVINFYREELSAIDDGAEATELLSSNERRRLRKKGVTQLTGRGPRAGTKIILTPRAKAVLLNTS
jgi:hypothetical protein